MSDQNIDRTITRRWAVSKPLAIDLFCGLGGWTEGLINSFPYCHGHACPTHEGPKEGEPIIFQDGTGENGKPMYCAVMQGFQNLQESHAAFDQDPRKAAAALALLDGKVLEKDNG